MKLVTFSKAQAPHGVGDTRLVSDQVAAQLQKAGAISSAEPWPTPPTGAKPKARQAATPTRPIGQSDNRKAQ